MFSLHTSVSDLEVRLITNGGADFQMIGFEIMEAFLEPPGCRHN